MDNLKFLKEGLEHSVVPIYEEVDVTGSDGTVTKKKELFITGPFLQGRIKNRNGRIYPVSMLEKAIDSFKKEKMRGVGVGGELNHPQSSIQVDLERVSHYISELYMEGDNGMGKAKIATTPMGEIARSLINDGMVLGVSTRGVGKLNKTAEGDDLVSDFELVTIDIVSDPSAPNAFVEAVMEGLEYYIDNGSSEIKLATTIDRLVEMMKDNLCVLPKKTEDRNQKLFSVINSVLDGLK